MLTRHGTLPARQRHQQLAQQVANLSAGRAAVNCQGRLLRDSHFTVGQAVRSTVGVRRPSHQDHITGRSK